MADNPWFLLTRSHTRKMQRTPVSFYAVQANRSNYNSNNLYRYSPYILKDNCVVVDREWWWDDCSSKTRALIEQRVAALEQTTVVSVRVGSVSVPHCDQIHPALTAVYHAYLDSYDYHEWFSEAISNGPRDVQLFELLADDKEALAQLTRHNVMHAEAPNDHQRSALKDLAERLALLLDAHKRYFVRLSSTSGKNERPLEPLPGCGGADALVSWLSNNSLFLSREYERANKRSFVVLMPWLDNFNERYEFRIFVRKRQLTGASQQKWFVLYQYSDEEIDAIETALTTSLPAIIADIPYNEWVGDVYIDIESKRCYLIECNAYGAHCGAGSALFEWKRDRDVLRGNSKPQLRYQSLIVTNSDNDDTKN